MRIGLSIAAAGVFLAATSARAETITVEIAKMAFSPAQISAHVGDTVVWDNKDILVHTATSRDHEWDITIPPHKAGQVVLIKPETIEYFCRFHPNMKGQITVEAK